MTTNEGNEGAARSAGPPGEAGSLTREFCSVLDQQEALLTSLLRLGMRQSELITREDPDALLDVLAQRQAVIEQIESANRDAARLRERWTSVEDRLSESEREAVRSRVDVIEGLMRQISERDDSDRKRLEQRRGEIAGELGAVVRGRGAVAAYANTAHPGGGARFQDRTG